ncbi:MAG: EAL domain-containing protein [Limosilactobacillus sp.]
MNDLKTFLFWTFIGFTAVCIFFCIEATIRYRTKVGIDNERGFGSKYEYFGQPICNNDGKLYGYELLLRELDPQSKRWRLPAGVADFPLSKVVHTIRQIDPKIIDSIHLLAINMTVNQITDFRAAYFVRWVRGVIDNQQLTIEIDAADLRRAGFWQRRRVRTLLKKIDRQTVRVAIENVDSTQQTYALLKPFLPVVDCLKFNVQAFKKSNHWIDITLAQWQRRAQKYGVTVLVSKVEDPDQVQLADQLNIGLRQGYAYGQPVQVRQR